MMTEVMGGMEEGVEGRGEEKREEIQDGIEIEIVEIWRLIVEVETVIGSMMVTGRVEGGGGRGGRQSGSSHSTGVMQLPAMQQIIMIMKSQWWLLWMLQTR